MGKFKLFMEAWEEEKKFINLKSVIKADEEDFIKYFNENATYKSKKAWLFVPPNSKNRICLVAHIDRIYPGPQKKKIINKKGKWVSPQGIAGDDRCGVYALFHIYRTLPPEHRPMLLFTDFEETGLQGATEAARVFKKQLKDVLFFIELDRTGGNEMVFYNWEHLDYPEFADYIKKHGFKLAHGTTSDIKVLGDKLQKASVNLSIGYYKQHSKEEYIIVKEMLDTINKVKNICIQNEPLPVKKPRPKYREEAPKYNLGDWRARYGLRQVGEVKDKDKKGKEVTRGYFNPYSDELPFWAEWGEKHEPKKYKIDDFKFADEEDDEDLKPSEYDTYADIQMKKKKREEREKKRREKAKDY